MNKRDSQYEMQTDLHSQNEISRDTDLGLQETDRNGGDNGDDGSGITAKWIATAAAVVVAIGIVGYLLMPAPSPPNVDPDGPGGAPAASISTNVGVEVIRDVARMKKAIEAMPLLDPELKQKLLASADRQTIEVLTFHINTTALDGEESDLVQTDMLGHRYTVAPSPQTFSLPATRDSKSFLFQALSSAPGATVSGVWTTPAGQQPYRLLPHGQNSAITVLLK